MPSSEGFVQGCNAQAAVDAKRKSTVRMESGLHGL